MLRTFILVTLLMVTAQTSHAHIYLYAGDSIQVDGQRIYCTDESSSSGNLQSATEKICQKFSMYGLCTSYDEKTIKGRFCAEGTICQKYDIYGVCTAYDTSASCGNTGCTVDKKCKKYSMYGDCISYDTIVSCQ